MEIKVSKNEWEIISSGYVVLAEGDEIEFAIESLKFKLSFMKDGDVGARVGKRYEKNGDYMSVICQNFDKSNFRTISQPIVLAQKDGRDMALELTVMSTSKEQSDTDKKDTETKVVFYCWCIRKDANKQHDG